MESNGWALLGGWSASSKGSGRRLLGFWRLLKFRMSEQGQASRREVGKNQVMMTLSEQHRDPMRGLKQESQMVTEGHTEASLNSGGLSR